VLIALLGIVIATMLPGCLSLGGKTVYSNESPQTSDRLSALENRVSILERAVAAQPVPPGTPIAYPPSMPNGRAP
jgi:hypothetical protein